MTWIVAVLLAGALYGLLATALLARRHRWRWGTLTTAIEVGGDPYRRFTTEAHSPRPIPAAVTAASLLSPIWALSIALVFAPAGLLLSAVLLGHGDIASGVASIGLVALCLHGFGVAAALASVPGALYRREADRVARLARGVLLHHGLVLTGFAGLAGAGHSGLLLIATPALLGLLLGWLLAAAARAAASLPSAAMIS